MTKVNCPQCQDEVVWDKTSLYRPFCSKRCKLLDLGAWAAEEHGIPGEDQTEDYSITPDDKDFNPSY
jgi:endogenous inhibitor of DNA gyrase (YacG/DUF329 family)